MIPKLDETYLEYDTKPNKSDWKNPKTIVEHLPTGLIAECDYTIDSEINKMIALGMLTQKVYDHNSQHLSPEELAESILLDVRDRLSETELVGMHSIDYQEGFWDCYNQMLEMLDETVSG